MYKVYTLNDNTCIIIIAYKTFTLVYYVYL